MDCKREFRVWVVFCKGQKAPEWEKGVSRVQFSLSPCKIIQSKNFKGFKSLETNSTVIVRKKREKQLNPQNSIFLTPTYKS